MSDLGALPGCSQSLAYSINKQGTIVGVSTKGNDHSVSEDYATVWDRGRPRLLSKFGLYSVAFAINKYGTMAGKTDGVAILWQGKREVVWDRPFSLALAVNAHGQAVGYTTNWGSVDSVWNDRHAFLYTSSSAAIGDVDLGTLPGDSWSEAHSINDFGEVVGVSASNGNAAHDPLSRDTHACLWLHGQSYDLNLCIPIAAGWHLAQADGINDRGQVVGNGVHNGKQRAFLLTPTIPLPH